MKGTPDFYCDLFLQLSPDLAWVNFPQLTEFRLKWEHFRCISEFAIFVQQPELRKYQFSVCMQISGLQENPISCSSCTWILVCWCIFFPPDTLLFATNQTNLKQKQNFSVYLRFVSACRAGLGCFHAYCICGKKHFQFSLFHACWTFFLIQNFGWLEKHKSVVLKGGWCGELGGEENFGIPAGGGPGLQTQIKNEFSRAGRWGRKENLTRSTSSLFWFYCKNRAGKCETSGDPVLPVIVWTGNGCGSIWELLKKCSTRKDAEQNNPGGSLGHWEGFL